MWISPSTTGVCAVWRAGMYDNTLVVYTADNGGTGAGINFPLRGEKHTNWEGGMYVFRPIALKHVVCNRMMMQPGQKMHP